MSPPEVNEGAAIALMVSEHVLRKVGRIRAILDMSVGAATARMESEHVVRRVDCSRSMQESRADN